MNGFVSVGAGDLSVSASASAVESCVDPSSPLRTICTPTAVDDNACYTSIATTLGLSVAARS